MPSSSLVRPFTPSRVRHVPPSVPGKNPYRQVCIHSCPTRHVSTDPLRVASYILTLGATVTSQSARRELLPIVLQMQSIRLYLQRPAIIPNDGKLWLLQISMNSKGRSAILELPIWRVLIPNTALVDDGEAVLVSLDDRFRVGRRVKRREEGRWGRHAVFEVEWGHR